jgi:hypothetical protein
VTIFCAWCNAVCGEKCPGCGSRDIADLGGFKRSCNNCLMPFEMSNGGRTATICEKCVRKFRDRSRVINPVIVTP